MLIPEYMARLDSDDPRTAMDLVEADVGFLLALPSGPVSGTSKDELWGYVSRRPDVTRRHHIIEASSHADFEAVYGVVTDDDVETGAFLASARLSQSGRMQRYLVHFDQEFRLFGADEVQRPGE
ncbi:nuclear transport factor 2 family protein [Saccharopolyspora erythraea]|uniref:nuclear transport factor 2 family protein n=1 Tax=Saccharopolyspora erythraea TaxID=1836 RepID=UPI001BAC597F|nr:nuclear transport factor 2 family protein [Saccharopolyspora erythraea]QUH02056.1 nuclear transport factor 2 family protein [Saccharopolyspora erythraea]